MQLLDDDMDELFRNAASQYPLKTDGSDWDAVMRRLPQSGNKQASAFNRLRDSKWLRWLWGPLMTLLVLSIWLPALKVGVLPPATGTGKSAVTNVTPVITGSNSNTYITKTNNTIVSDSKPLTAVHNKVAKTNNTIVSDSKPLTAVHNKVAKTNNTIVSDSKPLTAVHNKVAKTNNTIVSDSKPLTAVHNKVAKTNNTIVSDSKPLTAVATNNKTISAPVNVYDNNLVAVNNNTILSLHLLSSADHKEQDISAQLQSSGNIILLRKDTAIIPAKTKTKVQKGLYVGIVASPDFSTVKGQKVSNVGYNAGIIAGYRISRHLAVETGVLFERKYYYSEASYFSTKKINPPADMKIINVDGWCKMIEIPLNVRYVFNIKPKSNWYVNAGVSSYIMSKESYDYKYERYNTVSTRNWSYNNATRNWFSIIHIGVGYEHRLGAVGTLRVEPYLKLPAGGVGIGNLPLTSAGINIGITRPIRF